MNTSENMIKWEAIIQLGLWLLYCGIIYKIGLLIMHATYFKRGCLITNLFLVLNGFPNY